MISLTYNMDCMEYMKNMPDKFFELAIVDPPYFSGPERRGYYGRKTSPIGVQRHYEKSDAWEIPGHDYFDAIFRVSREQIIWGCNYFDYRFPGSGRIIWDKCNGQSTFSDAEIAYCSTHDSVRLFGYMWNGMMQGKSIAEGRVQQGNKALNEYRIHPTQKPVALYAWLLSRYANQGDKILDTHMGSGSSRIAAYKLGFDFYGCEIDKQFFDAQERRFLAECKNTEVINGKTITQQTIFE